MEFFEAPASVGVKRRSRRFRQAHFTETPLAQFVEMPHLCPNLPLTMRSHNGSWSGLRANGNAMKRLGVALVGFLACAMAAVAVAGGGLLSADDAARRVKNGEITMIDVRSPGEWRQTGIAPGAKRVTIHDPNGAEGFLRHMVAAVDGDRGRPIALICARGNRSTRAHDFLTRNGFTNVHNIVEGMLGNRTDPGWIGRGLPVVPCPSC